jgi:hypothetical protein
MAELALFCEDRGHELFARAITNRLAEEAGITVNIRVIRASRGKGVALSQLRGWQRSFEKGLTVGKPDLLAVVIDGNCIGFQAKQREIEALIQTHVFPNSVIGCPDPHVERWCFADAKAFERVVGSAPPRDPGKCERGVYKKLLRDSLIENEQVILTDEMEVAPEIVRIAELYRAGKAQPSLGAFVDGLRKGLSTLR